MTILSKITFIKLFAHNDEHWITVLIIGPTKYILVFNEPPLDCVCSINNQSGEMNVYLYFWQ